MTRPLRRVALLLVGLVGLGASAAQAEAAAPDVDWAYALAHELMSPFCPGRTLAECPSPNAAELRMRIINQAAAGNNREAVLALLYEEFGEDVLRSAPKAEGWGLTAYVIPIGFFVLGGPVVVMIIRRMALRVAAAADELPAPVAIDPELEAGLREEMERELRGS